MCMLYSQLHTAAYGCKISLQSAIALLIEGLHIDIHCIDIGEQLKQLLLLYIAICNNDVFQPVQQARTNSKLIKGSLYV